MVVLSRAQDLGLGLGLGLDLGLGLGLGLGQEAMTYCQSVNYKKILSLQAF